MKLLWTNYIDITLDSLAEKFYLSKPYISKYIKEKSGLTFGELVKNRLRRRPSGQRMLLIEPQLIADVKILLQCIADRVQTAVSIAGNVPSLAAML